MLRSDCIVRRVETLSRLLRRDRVLMVVEEISDEEEEDVLERDEEFPRALLAHREIANSTAAAIVSRGPAACSDDVDEDIELELDELNDEGGSPR